MSREVAGPQLVWIVRPARSWCSTWREAGTSASQIHERALSGEARRRLAGPGPGPQRAGGDRRDDRPSRRGPGETLAALGTDGPVRAPLGRRPRDGRRRSSRRGGRGRARGSSSSSRVPAPGGHGGRTRPVRLREPRGSRRQVARRVGGRAARTYPAWFVEAERPDVGRSWCTATRCRGWTTSDGSRRSATPGYPTLTITYRNDAGAPEDPSGLLRYGETEWEDLEAAVGSRAGSGLGGRGPVR